MSAVRVVLWADDVISMVVGLALAVATTFCIVPAGLRLQVVDDAPVLLTVRDKLNVPPAINAVPIGMTFTVKLVFPVAGSILAPAEVLPFVSVHAYVTLDPVELPVALKVKNDVSGQANWAALIPQVGGGIITAVAFSDLSWLPGLPSIVIIRVW